MKIHIYCDELYPYYGLANSPGWGARQVEISDELYAEIKAVQSAFEAMQDKLEKLAGMQAVPPPPAEPKLTQAEIDAIKETTPVEDPAAIQAAIDAVNARTKAA